MAASNNDGEEEQRTALGLAGSIAAILNSHRDAMDALGQRVSLLNDTMNGPCDTADTSLEDDAVKALTVPIHVADLFDRLRSRAPAFYRFLVRGGERLMNAKPAERRAVTAELADGILSALRDGMFTR